MLCMHAKVNPSADDDDAIRYASRAGHTDIVRILLWGDEVRMTIMPFAKRVRMDIRISYRYYWRAPIWIRA